MDESEYAWKSAAELAAHIKGGEIAPAELAELCLDRLERHDPSVRSFITVASDEATSWAKDLDVNRYETSSLVGVPFGAKDCLLTGGIRTTLASLLFEDWVPTTDADVVAALKREGATLVGKTNLPEFSSWGRSMNRVAGECRNPWDPARTSGASSGGSAAAVAAGFVPIAIGSDDGGSVRLPAALNGVVGVCASPGRVPMGGSVVIANVSAVGPLTRTVTDAAHFMDAVAPDGGAIADELRADPSDFRVAWIPDHEVPIADPRVVEAVATTAAALAAAGVSVDRPDVRWVDSWAAYSPQYVMDHFGTDRFGGMHIDELPQWPQIIADDGWTDSLSPYIDPARFAAGAVPPSTPEMAQRYDRVVAQLTQLLDQYDAVLTPTIDQIAPRVGDDWEYPAWAPGGDAWENRRAYVKYTMRVNMAGACAVSVPAGFVDAMPCGMQIICRRGAEATALRVARLVEQTVPWSSTHPLLVGG